MKLKDGTVVPSHLRLKTTSHDDDPVHRSMYENILLREGYIIRSYPPNSADNKSNRWLYDVEAIHGESNGPSSTVVYYGVRSASLFGSSADYCNFSYRADANKNAKGVVNGAPTRGARVLVLCINGISVKPNAVIIGALPHVGAPKDEANTFYESEFNGVNLHITKDGEIELTQKGPTDLDGKVTAPIDTTVKFTKDGGIETESTDSVKVTTDAKVVLTAEQIQAGSESSSIPVMLAHPQYVAAILELTLAVQTLATAFVALAGLVASGGADPALTTGKASFSGAPGVATPAMAAVVQAVLKVNTTLVDSIGISTKLVSE